MDFWSFNAHLTQRLKVWAVSSILFGLILQFTSRLGRGIGAQFVGWGIVNFLIAWFGSRNSRARQEKLAEPFDPEIQQQEATKLHRLLLVNAVLDIFYILGGFGFVQSRGRRDEFSKGNGLGIMLQGAFLFFFDLYQALMLKKLVTPDRSQANE